MSVTKNRYDVAWAAWSALRARYPGQPISVEAAFIQGFDAGGQWAFREAAEEIEQTRPHDWCEAQDDIRAIAEREKA